MAKGIYPPSVQPGIPRLTEPPSGWARVTYGEILREVQRPVKLDDETEYQLVVAKRSRGGIEPRERLLGKKILTKTQFEIKAQDFLVSNRQIVHGACGIVPQQLDGSVVSNEYTVLHANDALDLTFLNHFTNSIFFQQTCFHASVGVDVEKMIFRIAEWFKMELNLPPIEEQKKIAKILSTWDRAIEAVQSRIVLLEKRYKQLQHRIFDIAESKAKQFHTLAEVFNITKQGVNESRLASYDEVLLYSLPGFDLGCAPETVEGKSIASGKSLVPNECILFAKLNPRIPRVWYVRHESTIPAVCSTEFWVLVPRLEIDFFYFQSFLSSARFLNHPQIKPASSTNSHQRVNQESFESFEVSLPDLTFQKRAGSLFFTLKSEIVATRQNLDFLKKQKQGLMQRLLTGKVRVKV